MSVININVPNKIEGYIKDNSEFNDIISEVVYDYVEIKQDREIKNSLINNDYFNKLNNSLNNELGL